MPEKPKPEIPPRPANPIARDSNESIPISKINSKSSTGSDVIGDETQAMKSPPPAPKPKPAVPSRPAGSKIAALKAGFMSDLDKRLQLGPQGPTKTQEKKAEEVGKEEEAEEKAPLVDARKGRARGPTRRKPAAPSTSAERSVDETSSQKKAVETGKWAMQDPWAVWQLDEDGAISIAPTLPTLSSDVRSSPLEAYSRAIQNSTSAMATETAQQLDAQGTASTASLAKEAVESHAPISLDQVTATKDAEAGKTPQQEPMTETSNSGDLNTPTSSSSPHDPAAMTDAASQTGEKSIKANPGTNNEERMTAIIGGDVHGGGDFLVREEIKPHSHKQKTKAGGQSAGGQNNSNTA